MSTTSTTVTVPFASSLVAHNKRKAEDDPSEKQEKLTSSEIKNYLEKHRCPCMNESGMRECSTEDCQSTFSKFCKEHGYKCFNCHGWRCIDGDCGSAAIVCPNPNCRVKYCDEVCVTICSYWEPREGGTVSNDNEEDQERSMCVATVFKCCQRTIQCDGYDNCRSRLCAYHTNLLVPSPLELGDSDWVCKECKQIQDEIVDSDSGDDEE